MLTQEQIIEAVKAGRHAQCLDGRDYLRLAGFFPVDLWPTLGCGVIEGADTSAVKIIEWTRENVLERLRIDVDFGFEKALNQRGISAALMHEVVKMWMWVLEDDLQHHEGYALYGLPLFKAVAVKYGFDNPIGDDHGNESKYGE